MKSIVERLIEEKRYVEASAICKMELIKNPLDTFYLEKLFLANNKDYYNFKEENLNSYELLNTIWTIDSILGKKLMEECRMFKYLSKVDGLPTYVRNLKLSNNDSIMPRNLSALKGNYEVYYLVKDYLEDIDSEQANDLINVLSLLAFNSKVFPNKENKNKQGLNTLLDEYPNLYPVALEYYISSNNMEELDKLVAQLTAQGIKSRELSYARFLVDNNNYYGFSMDNQKNSSAIMDAISGNDQLTKFYETQYNLYCLLGENPILCSYFRNLELGVIQSINIEDSIDGMSYKSMLPLMEELSTRMSYSCKEKALELISLLKGEPIEKNVIVYDEESQSETDEFDDFLNSVLDVDASNWDSSDELSGDLSDSTLSSGDDDDFDKMSEEELEELMEVNDHIDDPLESSKDDNDSVDEKNKEQDSSNSLDSAEKQDIHTFETVDEIKDHYENKKLSLDQIIYSLCVENKMELLGKFARFELANDSEVGQLWYALYVADNHNFYDIEEEGIRNELALTKSLELSSVNSEYYSNEVKFYRTAIMIPGLSTFFRQMQLNIADTQFPKLTFINLDDEKKNELLEPMAELMKKLDSKYEKISNDLHQYLDGEFAQKTKAEEARVKQQFSSDSSISSYYKANGCDRDIRRYLSMMIRPEYRQNTYSVFVSLTPTNDIEIIEIIYKILISQKNMNAKEVDLLLYYLAKNGDFINIKDRFDRIPSQAAKYSYFALALDAVHSVDAVTKINETIKTTPDKMYNDYIKSQYKKCAQYIKAYKKIIGKNDEAHREIQELVATIPQQYRY